MFCIFQGACSWDWVMRRALYFTWQASICAKYRRKQPINKHSYSLPGSAVCVLNIEENTQQISNMIDNIYIYVYMFVLQIPQLEFQLPWMAGNFKWSFDGNSCISNAKGCCRSNPKQAWMTNFTHWSKDMRKTGREKFLGLWVNRPGQQSLSYHCSWRKSSCNLWFWVSLTPTSLQNKQAWGEYSFRDLKWVVTSKQPWKSIRQAE